ncbi:hypothetical protein ACOMHN_015395 [Nucella lapillus]
MILPFNSCHPRHCPRSIPYSQCLRLRRICSEDSVFEKRCQELKVKLQRRGYPGSLIDAAMRKVSDQPQASTLQYSRRNQQSKADRVPFIVRHNPSNPSLSLWLKQFLPVLHTSARMRKAAPVPPIVGHALTDMKCTVIEGIRMDNTDVRKQREKFWRYKLRTNYPEGLNVFD